MLRSGHGSCELTVVGWKRNLVIRGHLTGVKLWSVRGLGVLGVIVGVLVGVVVGHDVCRPRWDSWGYFIALKTRASVMEHSIDLISGVLTESDLIQGKYARGQIQRRQIAGWRTEEKDALADDSPEEQRERVTVVVNAEVATVEGCSRENIIRDHVPGWLYPLLPSHPNPSRAKLTSSREKTKNKMASSFTAWLRSPAAREYFFS